MIPKAYTTFLHLEDGKFYRGWSFFDSVSTIGEVVFNTGMTGYQEVITDPSYSGQIILFTYPEIGNTGVNIFDIESSQPLIKGLISRNICLYSSNWRSEISLVNYLLKNKIPHIFGIDTRHLTKYLRKKGVMLGSITNDKSSLSFSKSKIQNTDIISTVMTQKDYKWPANLFQNLEYEAYFDSSDASKKFNVVVLDYGVKYNILNRLIFHGCNIIVLPANTLYSVILQKNPDGILLSNGPGDPSLMSNSIHNIQKLLDYNIPIFGICLGHQLLSLAIGAKTHKLKFGHRGLNHPSGLVNITRITSQNHGYVVSADTVPKDIVDYIDWNLNDVTVSGIVHKYKPYFSVQYHPEASPGPHDSDYLFANFMKIISFFNEVC